MSKPGRGFGVGGGIEMARQSNIGERGVPAEPEVGRRKTKNTSVRLLVIHWHECIGGQREEILQQVWDGQGLGYSPQKASRRGK